MSIANLSDYRAPASAADAADTLAAQVAETEILKAMCRLSRAKGTAHMVAFMERAIKPFKQP